MTWRRLSSSTREILARLASADRVLIGPVQTGGLLVAERRGMAIDGELVPIRVVTMEAAPLPDGPDGRRHHHPALTLSEGTLDVRF